MTQYEAKNIMGYYNSTQHIFTNRPKTQEVIEAEKVLRGELYQYIKPPKKQEKEKTTCTIQDLQRQIVEEMGEGYHIIISNPYQNSCKRVYYLHDKNGKKYFLGKSVFMSAKTWLTAKQSIKNFYK